MPLSKRHKAESRRKIVESARILFNIRGLQQVSIDEIMAAAGLSRGGFYNHFASKEELYAEAVSSFLNGRGKQWRDAAGIVPNDTDDLVNMVAMLNSYLSDEHLGDLEGQCPMIALPSDVARAGPEVRTAYEDLLRAMLYLFESNSPDSVDRRHTALLLSCICVGGMVLSRTVDDEHLSRSLRAAALKGAHNILKLNA